MSALRALSYHDISEFYMIFRNRGHASTLTFNFVREIKQFFFLSKSSTHTLTYTYTTHTH